MEWASKVFLTSDIECINVIMICNHDIPATNELLCTQYVYMVHMRTRGMLVESLQIVYNVIILLY